MIKNAQGKRWNLELIKMYCYAACDNMYLLAVHCLTVCCVALAVHYVPACDE